MTVPVDVTRDQPSRLFKLLRRWLRQHPGLRSKHGANLALDILAANGIETIAIRRADGRLVHLATDDKVIAPGVIRHGAFSRDLMQAFAGLLRGAGHDPANLVFVNVGANIGTACLNAYDAGFRSFVAIEPEPRNFRLLGHNLADLPGANVRLVEAAVGENVGRLALHRHASNKGAHSLVAATDGGAATQDHVEVAVAPLASFMTPDQPFVMLVDVEGFEPQVLRGAGGLLARSCRGMVLEITPGKYSPADAADLAQRIAAFGRDLHLLPSLSRLPASGLGQLMADRRQGHFDIGVLAGT